MWVFRARRSLAFCVSKRSISEVPFTRPLLNTSGWRSFAGSTSRVACKAKSWSQRMRRGGWGMEQNLFCRFSSIVLWARGADYEPVTIVAAWHTGSEARRAHAHLLHPQDPGPARLPGCARRNAPAHTNGLRVLT